MSRIVNILAGGPKNHLPDLSLYRERMEEEFWIGVDRGVQYLFAAGITPDLALGDFDSIPQEIAKILDRAPFPVRKFPAEKDQTDMELALEAALEYKPDEIRIFGATGGRLDHLLANIQLLSSPQYLEKVRHLRLIDKSNILEVKRPGSYTLEKDTKFPFVSFIPLTPVVENLTLQGFKYPLKNATIPFGSTLCISNELITDSGTFLFSAGILLVIRSSDS